MADLARLLRTVAHLERGQVAYRLLYTARRAVQERRGAAIDARYERRAEALPAPRFDHPGLARVAALREARRDPEAALATARDALEGRFTFLSETRELGRDVDWFRADLDAGTRLWKTLLHEFPYALDLASAFRASGDPVYRRRFAELFESWRAVAHIHRPGADHDSWDPRAVATRIITLSITGSLLGYGAGDPETAALGRSLGVHALYLREHLEWDIRANHLLRDAVGLVFAHELLGCDGGALVLLRDQVEEQVLDDGCHYERAPLYHAIVLQDLVEVRALLGERGPDWLEDAVARMAGYLAYLLPEDGALPLFGDTWQDEVEPRALLAEVGGAARAPAPGAPERASGLVSLRAGPLHVVMRAGPHGPDFQLGHAHADGLSFELSHGARRIVTDTGTFTYDRGPAREHVRSTAAHNTVQLDGGEQIEFWDSFRVGRRGHARLVARGAHETWQWIWAAHEGWHPLEHQRLLLLSPGAVLVLDAVTGNGPHRVASALHLHPDAPDLTVHAFHADVTRTPAPLHERWGETREMTRLHTETQTTLPWLGGWLLDFEATAPDESQLAFEAGVAHANTGAATICWNLHDRSVEIDT